MHRLPLGRSSTVSAIVKLDVAPLASYAGDVPGLAATSPEAIGALRLEARSTASQRYLASMDRRLSDFEQAALLQIPQTRVTAHFGVHIGSQELLLSVCPPSASRSVLCAMIMLYSR